MYKATIVLPISRDNYLGEIFNELNTLDCKFKDFFLLIIVDGGNSLHSIVEEYVNKSKFKNHECIQYKSKHQKLQYDLQIRRLRIAKIHNVARKYLPECKYVIGFEDDTLMPNYTIDALLSNYESYPNAGFIQGVELGRWGIPYIGDWKFDDIHNPTTVTSSAKKEDIHSTDAGGLYCFITKREYYAEHEFKPFGTNDLGPDVDFGLSLRLKGLKNYTDYDISCIHRTGDKHLSLEDTTPSVITIIKNGNRWRVRDNTNTVPSSVANN